MARPRIGILDLLSQIRGSAEIATLQTNFLPPVCDETDVADAYNTLYNALCLIRTSMQYLANCYGTPFNERPLTAFGGNGIPEHQPNMSVPTLNFPARIARPIKDDAPGSSTAKRKMDCSEVSPESICESAPELGTPSTVSQMEHTEENRQCLSGCDLQSPASMSAESSAPPPILATPQAVSCAEEMQKGAENANPPALEANNALESSLPGGESVEMEVTIGDTESDPPLCLEGMLKIGEVHLITMVESRDMGNTVQPLEEKESLRVNVQSTIYAEEMFDLTSDASPTIVPEHPSETENAAQDEEEFVEDGVYRFSREILDQRELSTGVGTPPIAEERVAVWVNGVSSWVEESTNESGTSMNNDTVLLPKRIKFTEKDSCKESSPIPMNDDKSSSEAIASETDSARNDIAIPCLQVLSVSTPLPPSILSGSKKIYLAGVANFMPILYEDTLIEPCQSTLVQGKAVDYVLFDSEKFRPPSPFPQDMPYCAMISAQKPTMMYHRKNENGKGKWIVSSRDLCRMLRKRSLPTINIGFVVKQDEFVLFLNEEDTQAEFARRYIDDLSKE